MELIRLGLRLSRGGRRLGIATILTGIAAGAATIILIASIIAPGILSSRQGRDEARQPRAADQATGMPTAYYNVNTVRLDGKAVRLIKISRDADGPLPPGISRDAAGWVVSPALARWAESNPLARTAFPFALTTPHITREGLEDPGDLMAYELGLLESASPNAYPIGGFGSPLPERGGVAWTRGLTAVLFVGLPLVAVLWAAARLSSQRKDSRMRSLRTLGLSQPKVAFVAAVEISSTVLLAAVISSITTAIAVPHLSRFEINGASLDPPDVNLLPAIPIAIVIVTLFATCVATACLWMHLRTASARSRGRSRRNLPAAVAPLLLAAVAVTLAVVGRPNPSGSDRSLSSLRPLIPLFGIVMVLALPGLIRLAAGFAASRDLGPSTSVALQRIRTETETAARPARMLSVSTFVLIVTLVILTAFAVDLSWSTPHRRPDDLALLRVSSDAPTFTWTPTTSIALVFVPVLRQPDNTEVMIASCSELSIINAAPVENCDTAARRLTVPDIGDPTTVFPDDPPILPLTTANELSFGGMIRVDPSAIPPELTERKPSHYFVVVPRAAKDTFVADETARNPWTLIQASSIDLIDVAPDSGGRWVVMGAFVALLLGVIGTGITALEQALAARPTDRRFLILGASQRQRRRRTIVELLSPLLPGGLLGAGCGLLAGIAYRNASNNGSLIYKQLLIMCSAAIAVTALLALAALPAARTRRLESLSSE